jgi:exopolysaccharide biosynthesis polyprenyl glycosylphosphotransferase
VATPSRAAPARGAEAASETSLRALPEVVSETLVPEARPDAIGRAVSRLSANYAARWFLFCDVCFALIAYLIMLMLRTDLPQGGLVARVEATPSLSMVVLLGITFLVFYALGLYERELLALRALHLLALAKALLWSAALSALVMYLAHLPIQFESRLIVVSTFALFFVFAALVRVLVLSRMLAPRFRDDMRRTLVVGWPYRTEPLRERLHMLRGFNKVTLVEAVSQEPVLTRAEAYLDERDADGRRCFGSLFIDAGSLTLQQTLALIRLGAAAGVTTYVASNMLRPIAARRLLIDLFEAPVVRVRRVPGQDLHAPAKRVFDTAGALVALTLLAIPMIVIAVAVKVTSPGPVFYAQERVGRRGRRFKFYKFRSMRNGADKQPIHCDYMVALINGDAEKQEQHVDGEVEDVYKLVDDPRVTKVGRLLRRYSLDELPQFLNVIRGEMSLVGPRPPLPYEVDAYKPWHHRRLAVKPGITGVWQVDGRSRVGFDDMVFQDVMYDCTRDLLVDTSLCVRTVPAALLGHGAA